ncbi:MAG: Yip1 family protein [Methanofastidiosum sp.]
MVGNDYDDLKMEYVKLKQQLDTFMQIMPRMGYSGAPVESKEIVTKLDEIKEILSAAAVEEGGVYEDPIVGKLEKLINLLESSMVVEGAEGEEDKLMDSLSKVATTMEQVAESIRMNTEKLQEMEKTFKTMGQTYSTKQEPLKKMQYEPEERFERRITEEKKEPSSREKHEALIDETLDEFSESEFLRKVNQVLPEERIETIFSKRGMETGLMDEEPSMEDILREAQELGIDTKELMKDIKGGGTKTKASGSIFAPITLYILGIFWLVFAVLFLFNSMGMLPANNPISSVFNILRTGFMGLIFYIVMMVTGIPPILFGMKARTPLGSKGSDNGVLYVVGALWLVSGILFLVFKGLPGLPLPDLGITLDLGLSLILIFSSALAIVMGTEFSRKKILI